MVLKKKDYKLGKFIYDKENKNWTIARDKKCHINYFWTQLSIPQINKLILMTSHIEQEYSAPVRSRFEIMDLSEK
jgi:hypothetical protein